MPIETRPDPARSTRDPRPDPRGRAGELASSAAAALELPLRQMLADVLALFLKTKGFHWHVGGRHFRDDHLLLDEQAGELLAMVDPLAERARKLGLGTLGSIGDVARHQRLRDADPRPRTAEEMLAELRTDNRALAAELRLLHARCDEQGDIASASLVEVWVDEAERRTWFLTEVLGGAR
ncbi:MAG TPA: DNA starvation/stationary phase protection protein [Planctomycetota bacterium]